MVPNKFNMIDLDGLDIIESQGVIVSGLYDKLVESIALCRYQCIYNWKFNSIPIPPTYVELDSKEDGVWINDGIVVSQDDIIHIYTIEPEPPVINPLNVASNGIYNVSEGVDGFNPVSVQVPPPVIISASFGANGDYQVPAGVDGFNPVSVHVEAENLVSVNHNMFTYTPNVTAAGAMSAGLLITVDRELLISKFRVFANENVVNVHIAEDGVEIASVMGASVTPNTWNDIDFPSNVRLVPSKQYTAWYSHNNAHPKAVSGVAPPYIPFVNYIGSAYNTAANTLPNGVEYGTMMGADLFIYAIVADI